jgi:hypothetical protein
MAKFSEVFSITWKVLLALLLISILCAVGSLVFFGTVGGIVSAIIGTKSTQDQRFEVRSTSQSLQFDEADAFRTTMPQSAWNRGMERAVRKHCYIKGMNEEEVARALGPPTTKESNASFGDTWTWLLPGGKCLKYDGDSCVEKAQRKYAVQFTTKRYASVEVGCQTLDSQFVYFRSVDLFNHLPPSRATILEQIEPCKNVVAPDWRHADMFC